MTSGRVPITQRIFPVLARFDITAIARQWPSEPHPVRRSPPPVEPMERSENLDGQSVDKWLGAESKQSHPDNDQNPIKGQNAR